MISYKHSSILTGPARKLAAARSNNDNKHFYTTFNVTRRWWQ